MFKLNDMFKLRLMRPYGVLQKKVPSTFSPMSRSTAPEFFLEIVHLVKKKGSNLISL